MQKVLWSPWAQLSTSRLLLLLLPPPIPLLRFCFRVTTPSAQDLCGCSIAAGEPGSRRTMRGLKRARKRSRDFQEPSAFLSPEYFIACMPKAPHIKSHVSGGPRTLHKSPSAHARTRTLARTHVRGVARMNTQRTGVPGAGLFSEQSDIYRKGKEGRRRRKVVGRGRGEEEEKEEEREVCYDSSGSD